MSFASCSFLDVGFYAEFAKKNELPVISSPCPADKTTQREEMKQLLRNLERQNKGLRYRIFGAITRGEIDGFREFGRMEGIKNYENDDTDTSKSEESNED